MRKTKIGNLILKLRDLVFHRKKPDSIPKINVNGDNNEITIIIER